MNHQPKINACELSQLDEARMVREAWKLAEDNAADLRLDEEGKINFTLGALNCQIKNGIWIHDGKAFALGTSEPRNKTRGGLMENTTIKSIRIALDRVKTAEGYLEWSKQFFKHRKLFDEEELVMLRKLYKKRVLENLGTGASARVYYGADRQGLRAYKKRMSEIDKRIAQDWGWG